MTAVAPPPRDDRQEQQRRDAGNFFVHIGVDAAKGHHAMVARGPRDVVVEQARVLVNREGFEGYLEKLALAFPGIPPAKMLVGIEFAGHHGSTLAHFLRDRGFVVVSVLAMSTKKTREAALNSRLKSDLRDARQICTLVREGVYVRYPFPRPDIAACKELAMRRHRLGVERARMTNRLRGILDRIWPEFEGHFSDLDHETPRVLLRHWPSPEKLVLARRKARNLIRETSRGQHPPEWIAEFFRSAQTSIGVSEALCQREEELLLLLDRWSLLNEQIASTDQELEGIVKGCREASLLCTIPMLGANCAAAIVGELGDPGAFRHPDQILKLAGYNLAHQQSGFTTGPVRITKRGRPMLRRQLYLLAGRWCTKGMPYAEDAARLKAAGRKGKERCVILARRLVPVLFAVLQSGRPFSLATFQANRRLRPDEPKSEN